MIFAPMAQRVYVMKIESHSISIYGQSIILSYVLIQRILREGLVGSWKATGVISNRDKLSCSWGNASETVQMIRWSKTISTTSKSKHGPSKPKSISIFMAKLTRPSKLCWGWRVRSLWSLATRRLTIFTWGATQSTTNKLSFLCLILHNTIFMMLERFFNQDVEFQTKSTTTWKTPFTSQL